MIGATQLIGDLQSTPVAQVVTSGLVTRLESFGQGYSSSTTQWDDLSGNNNHFTRSGNVALATYGGVSDVWSFTGGYFNFKRPSDNANNGYGVFNNDNYTTEIWVNYVSQYAPSATPWLWSYDYSSHSSPYYYQYSKISGYANNSFSTYNGGYMPAGSISGGNWYQLVGTRTGGSSPRGKAYLNGVEQNVSLNASREILYGYGRNTTFEAGYNQEAWIGRGNYGSYGSSYTSFLKGAIGIVRMYDRQLSAAEILQNYNANKAHFNLT